MNLLKWKTINEAGQKIIYAEGAISRHWAIYKTDKQSYSVKLPEGTIGAHGWTWYSYARLQDAKDACEWWNKEFILERFSEQEKATLYKFFDLMNKIEEAHAQQ